MDKKNIQLFVPTYNIEECMAEIKECLEIGWTGLGFKTIKFEDAWKAYTGLPNAHFLNSNTVGLQLAIKIYKHELKWNDGDEVITTPLTFVSTNHAILYENLKPIFADVDDTLCLSPKSVEERITPKTRAVMYVGMGGNAGKLNEIVALCKKYNLILILDAAHMTGTRYQGKHAGADIDCSVFSFQAVKNLPTGDSGMICFKDNRLDAEVRKWSWLGINKDTYSRMGTIGNYKWLYDVEYVGLKAHGNSIMAALGLVQLKYVDADNERRREIVELYKKLLSVEPNIRFIKLYDDCISSSHLFQIQVPKEFRNELIVYLNSKGIFPGVHYRSNIDYHMYNYAKGTCPNADDASNEIISLPNHMRLTDDDIHYVSDIILDFFKEQKPGVLRK
jgi:dTDP-4-amino-4,6-dideoxygalactose transaminase